MSKPRRYAEGTDVPVSRSRDEIMRILDRFGASGFAFASQGRRAMVMFEARDRRIRFVLPEPKIAYVPALAARERREAAEERRLWRSLAMAIKSKLDMVESGITTFEDEFLPYTMLPNGQTFAEAAREPSFQTQLTASTQPPIIALPPARQRGNER